MKIYLDTCCYGRPYDDRTQIKNVMEAAAVMAIIEACRIARYCIVGSLAVESELGEIRNVKKRTDIETFFYATIDMFFVTTAKEDARARILQAEGLGVMDSYHLAVAEATDADVLLTTDADFVRICAKKSLSLVNVMNPLNFLPEVKI